MLSGPSSGLSNFDSLEYWRGVQLDKNVTRIGQTAKFDFWWTKLRVVHVG